jgi:two-component system heavy metal sensor histidine kinase CusS
MRRLSLSSRLALLFAACTAVVSLFAGVLFSRASEAHFVELDQQLLDGKLIGLRRALHDIQSSESETRLADELSRQADLSLRITGSDGQRWYDSSTQLPDKLPQTPGLSTLNNGGTDYRVLNAPLFVDKPDSPQLTLLLDITHHQHFLQRMQHLIWLTVGLSALATALLGAWAARSGLRPLRRMSAVARGVSAQSLNARLPEENMPPELAELAHSFNAMLGRLDDSFQRLSAFSADIAHELRTVEPADPHAGHPHPPPTHRGLPRGAAQQPRRTAMDGATGQRHVVPGQSGSRITDAQARSAGTGAGSGSVAGVFCAAGGRRSGDAHAGRQRAPGG